MRADFRQLRHLRLHYIAVAVSEITGGAKAPPFFVGREYGRVLALCIFVLYVMFMRFRLTRLMMWMGLAAAATYFFDPDRGEQRRKDLRKRVDKMRKVGEKAKIQAGL